MLLTTDNTTWTVTALLYSGRQNPAWLLTATEQRSWMELWQSAVLNDTAQKPLPGLGYSGCTLQFEKRSHWHLFNGCVLFYEKGKVIAKKDNDRTMELLLLSSAPLEVKQELQLMKII